MSFGRPMDKRAVLPLVRGTKWNSMLELNRMAFTDRLPRNSESRALGIAMRMLRKHRPDIQWVLSFADATQCGDGTIYRAAGFVLTGIKPNSGTIRLPSGEVVNKLSYSGGHHSSRRAAMLAAGYTKTSEYLNDRFDGWEKLHGFQLRYIYFIDPTARERLTVPILPFSEIKRRGASMYLGKPRAGSDTSDTPVIHTGEGGSSPTPALSVS